jgi:hypothetical protein
MTTKSPWFDRISAVRQSGAATAEAEHRCQHPGCTEPAAHRAPQGRDREGQYFWFCIDHVRDYNKTYNYFTGMTDAAVAAYQKDAVIGHRPTWTMGHNSSGAKASTRAKAPKKPNYNDPFNLFHGAPGQTRTAPEPERRIVKNAERKALDVLDLDDQAAPEIVRARYKELVKRLHPDANGGDRGSEDKLRAVIQAYKYLKKSGLG